MSNFVDYLVGFLQSKGAFKVTFFGVSTNTFAFDENLKEKVVCLIIAEIDKLSSISWNLI